MAFDDITYNRGNKYRNLTKEEIEKALNDFLYDKMDNVKTRRVKLFCIADENGYSAGLEMFHKALKEAMYKEIGIPESRIGKPENDDKRISNKLRKE